MSIVFLCFCTEFSLIPCQCRNNCHGTHILGATQMGRENVRFAKLASPISTNSNAKGAPRPPFFPTEGVSENVVLWGSCFGMQGRFQVEVWERGRFQLKFVEGFGLGQLQKHLKLPFCFENYSSRCSGYHLGHGWNHMESFRQKCDSPISHVMARPEQWGLEKGFQYFPVLAEWMTNID